MHDHHHHLGGHHGPHHGAADETRANQRRLAITLALAACYMVAEVVGGLITGSLALLADAGHMLSDVAALALSLFAMRLAARPPTPKFTYGFHRFEILAALVNGATLIAIVFFILKEAWQRLGQPPEVQGLPMLLIAGGGLVINLIGLWILNAGRSESLNVRGAWLHVLTDALGSVGAIVAGATIWAFGWQWADPVASVLIGLLVAYSSWALLRETVAVLMEGVPAHLDAQEVVDAIEAIEGVDGVHDLHIWTISSRKIALSCHVEAADDARPLLAPIGRMLHDRFEIEHATIQVECSADGDCPSLEQACGQLSTSP